MEVRVSSRLLTEVLPKVSSEILKVVTPGAPPGFLQISSEILPGIPSGIRT